MRVKELVKVFEKVGIDRYTMDNRGTGIIKTSVMIRGKWYKVNVYWNEIAIIDELKNVVLFTGKKRLERQLKKMLSGD